MFVDNQKDARNAVYQISRQLIDVASNLQDLGSTELKSFSVTFTRTGGLRASVIRETSVVLEPNRVSE